MTQKMLPAERQVLDAMADAEVGPGWLASCAELERFITVTVELVESLAEVLRELGCGPVLEVAAGKGELAAALRAAACPVIATDRDPPQDSGVIRLDAAEALQRYRPPIVLGSFVPAGSEIDAAVLAAHSVQHYLVINARVGGLCGDSALWKIDGWWASPLPQISRRLITRHDVWLGRNRSLLRRGEVWHFRRDALPSDTHRAGEHVSRSC